MINIKQTLKDAYVNCVKLGIYAPDYVVIELVKQIDKGRFTEEDMADVMNSITAWQEEQERLKEIKIKSEECEEDMDV